MLLSSKFSVEKLKVNIFQDSAAMGVAAADAVERTINKLLEQKSEVRIIFAAAASQLEFLDSLVKRNIDWSKVVGFHMDEYIGLDSQAPQLFGNFLREHIFDKVNFKKVHFLEAYNGDPAKECERYSSLLTEKPIDIVCMGIGENGHLAFNDPHVADFNDPYLVKVVEMDEASRQQQVNDGAFKAFEEVPTTALTLTIPALLSAEYKFVIVPGELKANAVNRTLNGEITTECPASILRHTQDAELFLDGDSSGLLKQTDIKSA